jgi:hypothetical protein
MSAAIFDPLRFHIKGHGLPSISQTGLELFRNRIYDLKKVDTPTAILDLINEEWEGGKAIDKNLLKSIVGLRESMGTYYYYKDKSYISVDSLAMYQADFEKDLLIATKEYYHSGKSDLFLEEVERKECECVDDYLNHSSKDKILATCREAFGGENDSDHGENSRHD